MKFLLNLLLILSISVPLVISFAPNSWFSTSFEADKDVIFFLRNQKIGEESYTSVDKENLESSTRFNPSKPTTFYTHGFAEDRKIDHHVELSRNLLNKSDINLFFVDWGKGAKSFDNSATRARVDDVAKTVAEFFTYLHAKFNVDVSKTTCIGFSLGAHICGLVYKYLTDLKFGKILGLDPAGQLFYVKDNTTRLSTASASYVECIHTGYPLGIRAPICTSDFFVNKEASRQPGCQNFFGLDTPACSHKRAVIYYSEALLNPKAFYGKSCNNSFKSALQGNCNGEFGAFMYDDDNAAKNITGIFSVMTNAQSPFGKGQN